MKMKLIFVVYGWYETTMLNMKKMNEIKKKHHANSTIKNFVSIYIDEGLRPNIRRQIYKPFVFFFQEHASVKLMQ